jgi:hypothetical protein
MLTEKDYFMMSLIYGPVNAFAGILGAAQTSFVMMISALDAIDAPLQTGWHKKGLDMFYHTWRICRDDQRAFELRSP